MTRAENRTCFFGFPKQFWANFFSIGFGVRTGRLQQQRVEARFCSDDSRRLLAMMKMTRRTARTACSCAESRSASEGRKEDIMGGKNVIIISQSVPQLYSRLFYL